MIRIGAGEGASSLPVYLGESVFRTPDEQSRLRVGLDRALEAEQKFDATEQEHLMESSDAYLIQKPSGVTNIDPIPLTIALWRLRLWEGEDWRANSSAEVNSK